MQLAFNAFDLEPAEVRRRFQAARQTGHPQWLWPDVSFERWRTALRAIEMAARAVLGDGGHGALLCDDPEALGVACYTSGTGPLLGFWSEQGRVAGPPEVEALLALHLAHNRSRIASMTRIANDVVSALVDESIDVTVLKGMHTAHTYFPEPGARPLSDIDLHIAPSDEAIAGRVLASLDFEQEKIRGRWPPERMWRRRGGPHEPKTLCFVHADDPWVIDLQTSLYRRPPDRHREAKLEEARREFSHSCWTCNPRAAHVLDQPLLLLQIADHASYGLESLTMLRMIELVLIIRRDQASGSLSWAEFLDLGRRTGALGFTYPALHCSEKISSGTVPAEVLDECRAAAPETVRRIVDRLTPASAHRADHWSLAERYMWADTWSMKAHLLGADLIPPNVTSMADIYAFYRKRFWLLVRRTVTWRMT